jgi:hypothetical protein
MHFLDFIVLRSPLDNNLKLNPLVRLLRRSIMYIRCPEPELRDHQVSTHCRTSIFPEAEVQR